MRYDSYTRLINGKHPLPEGYVPKQLTDIGLPFQASSQDSRRLLEIRTAQAALRLFQSAQRDGLNLYGIAGYRSYQCQKQLYGQNPYVAAPGTSEHQSGLALDVSCAEAGFALTEEFAFTSEGSWLSRNASLFGFIIRYPKGKENITGFPWEPWHIRYVTRALSNYLALTGQTLEEYYALRPF